MRKKKVKKNTPFICMKANLELFQVFYIIICKFRLPCWQMGQNNQEKLYKS